MSCAGKVSESAPSLLQIADQVEQLLIANKEQLKSLEKAKYDLSSLEQAQPSQNGNSLAPADPPTFSSTILEAALAADAPPTKPDDTDHHSIDHPSSFGLNPLFNELELLSSSEQAQQRGARAAAALKLQAPAGGEASPLTPARGEPVRDEPFAFCIPQPENFHQVALYMCLGPGYCPP